MKATTKERFCELAGSAAIVPVYREIPGDMDTPVSVLKRFADDDLAVLLESVEGGENLGRYSFLGVNPYGVFFVQDHVPYTRIGGIERKLPYAGNPLNALRDIIGNGKVAVEPDLPPLPGGAIGFLSYEASGLFESLPAPKGSSGVPECLFMLTDEIIAFDNRRHTIKVIVNVHTDHHQTLDGAFEGAQNRLDRLESKIRQPSGPHETPRGASPVE